MKTKAIIFDMDGTTVDSIKGLMHSMNLVLEEANLPIHNVDTYKMFVGNGLREFVLRALPEDFRTEENVNKSFHLMIKSYEENWDYQLGLFEGIPELFDYLTEKGVKISINTNKVDSIARLIVDRYFKKWNVECIIGDQLNLPQKPNPLGAIKIMETLGVVPEECIYVGDSAIDVDTAFNANIKSVAVTWGYSSKDELIKANYIIKHPLEIIELL